MSDQKLLELAALSIGETVVCSPADLGYGYEGVMLYGVQDVWKPLNDYGDALKLAVDRQIFILPGDDECMTMVGEFSIFIHEPNNGNPRAAACRAIVRAAAKIGEKIQSGEME